MSGPATVTVVGIGDDGWGGLAEPAREALRSAAGDRGQRSPARAAPRDRGPPGAVPVAAACPARRPGRRQPRAVPAGQRRPDAARAGRDPGRPPGLRPAAGAAGGVERRPGLRPARLGRARRRRRVGWCRGRSRCCCQRSSPAPACSMLCRDGGTPAALARLLVDRGWGASELTVLEHLGRRRPNRISGPLAAARAGPARSPTSRWWPWSAGPGPGPRCCRGFPGSPTTPTRATAS